MMLRARDTEAETSTSRTEPGPSAVVDVTDSRGGADGAPGVPRKPGPKPQWAERLNVMVAKDLIEELDRRATAEGITRSALARRLLLERLRELKEIEARQSSLDAIEALLRDVPPEARSRLVSDIAAKAAKSREIHANRREPS